MASAVRHRPTPRAGRAERGHRPGLHRYRQVRTGLAVFRQSSSAAPVVGTSESNGELCAQRVAHECRHQPVDIAPERRDLSNQARADERMSRRGHQADHFNIPLEMGVHVRQLELVFEIRNCAQPAYDNTGILRAGVIYGQPGKTINANVWLELRRHDLAGQPNALLGGKERTGLLLALVDRDDDLVEQLRSTACDVDMAKRNGIETAGVDRASRVHAAPMPGSPVDPTSVSSLSTCK